MTLAMSALAGEYWSWRHRANFGALIDLSGRQRTLSQQIAFFAISAATATSATDRSLWREKLRSAHNSFSEAQRKLSAELSSISPSEKLARDLHSLQANVSLWANKQDNYVQRLIPHWDKGTADSGYAQEIARVSAPLLASLEQVVSAYVRADAATTACALRWKWLAVTASLFLFWMEFGLVYQPLVRTMVTALDSLTLLRLSGEAPDGDKLRVQADRSWI